MFEKINTNNLKETAADSIQNVGYVAMGLAMTIGIAELAGAKHPALAPAMANVQPAGEHGSSNGSGHESMRRVEEVGPHHSTYGTVRTPSRSGSK